jgi:hypothetical protein
MKKSILCLIMLMAFTLAAVPVVIAHPIQPLRAVADLTFDWGVGTWTGTITGDIEGEFEVTPAWAIFPGGDPAALPPPGMTEHFGENWVITTSVGTIEIYDEGVWTFNTFKFRANGRVTDATGAYEYLIGAKVHIMGSTTALDPPTPVYGTGYMQFN